ncbi:MAG: LicD family protein [Lachnospiraceae bacterium]|nr:LicD family protein [Lachnospiraceae bacterium]
MRELSLKEVQERSLELLCEFDTFCKENDIDYYICGGTLLGAVRHHGFIPWDDDTDVMMLRRDYEKMLRVIKKAEIIPERKFIYSRNHTFARHYCRYVRTDFVKKEDGFSEDDCPWLGLDIFPVDFVNNDKTFIRQVKKLKILRSLLLIGVTKDNLGKNPVARGIKKILRPFIKHYGIFRIVHHMEKTAARYSHHETEYVAGICGMYGLREIWKYSDFKEKTRLDFEGHSFQAPAKYDIYLSNLYGDYMQLPPEDKRKYTDARVFEK